MHALILYHAYMHALVFIYVCACAFTQAWKWTASVDQPQWASRNALGITKFVRVVCDLLARWVCVCAWLSLLRTYFFLCFRMMCAVVSLFDNTRIPLTTTKHLGNRRAGDLQQYCHHRHRAAHVCPALVSVLRCHSGE